MKNDESLEYISFCLCSELPAENMWVHRFGLAQQYLLGINHGIRF